MLKAAAATVEYEYHPLANIFPLIEGQSYLDLMADVLKNGVREPVWLYEGRILDGRNRWRAAKATGVKVETREYTGDDATGFVISLNLHRRHLSESQRAAVAAKLANMVEGGKAANSANLQSSTPISQAAAASMLNVSTRSVAAAAKVQQSGVPELAAALDAGEVSVSAAAAVAALPVEQQQEVVAAGPQAVREVAKAVRKTAADIFDPNAPTRRAAKPRTDEKSLATVAEIKAAKERGVSMLCTYARLFLAALKAADNYSDEERQLVAEVNQAILSTQE